MSTNTKIEWTDHTFNPWIGCTKVSPGCAKCYAETLMDKRYGRVKWGKGNPRSRTSEANWKLPLRWNAMVANERQNEMELGPGRVERMRNPRVFCASLADWLDDEVPIEWLADLLTLIHDTPNLIWQLLTKRPENWRERVDDALDHLMEAGIPGNEWLGEWLDGKPPRNVWIGTSVEDQPRADERIPKLLEIPAKIRFLSCEPLLGPIELDFDAMTGCADDESPIHWIIIGGESGPSARLCNIDWIRDLVRQCRYAGVAPFIKQLGAHPVLAGIDLPLRDKKGGDPSEWLGDLRVRRFPV